jgi:tetratricopeptide (TPR) repeat protein
VEPGRDEALTPATADDGTIAHATGRAAGSDPLCFVLVPVGHGSDGPGSSIDFDAVYQEVLSPAIRAARLQPIRADDGVAGGIIRGPMLERLVLCEFAVADLTFADPDVFYGLGVRHAVRPSSTVVVFASGTGRSSGVALDRGLPYAVDDAGRPEDVTTAREQLTERLLAARGSATHDPVVDSPVLPLVEGFPQIDRLRTDVFRDRMRYAEHGKERLARARGLGRDGGFEAVRAVERELGDLADAETGILVDLFLSYRAVGRHAEMVELFERMPRPVTRTTLVREQLGFALNRLGRRAEAERVLTELIEEQGPSSETCGLLGRVYKDEWDEAEKAGEPVLAQGRLDKAIETYLVGFEADWRDAYPGINAVTLMELRDPPDPRREQLIPVVTYAVDRRLASGRADYWDHATRLELAVLGKDRDAAGRALAMALAAVREPWEPGSTANNLALIRRSRAARAEDVPWAQDVERELLKRAGAAPHG